MERYIYPEVKVSTVMFKGGRGFMAEDSWRVTLESYLRKKHRGKYYLQKFWREFYYPVHELSANSIAGYVNHFHAEVYKSIVLGKGRP